MNSNNIYSTENETGDLYVGKVFISWQEVTIFLNDFCLQRGFGYRKIQSMKHDVTEEAAKRTFLCKHAGINKPNKTVPLNEQHNRTSYKVNCSWRVNISKKGEGIYVVTTYIDKHKGHSLNLQTANINVVLLSEIFIMQFISSDIKKNLQKRMHIIFLILYWKKKAIDLEWVVEYQLDSISRSLTHILWMELQQVELYIRYGSVIAYDNTAKMNIYGLSLSIFVIVDNNYNISPVAQAFLDDET
ncbi:7365_t:CDS:2 [Funneliformis geosporum]|nr:7365_t:CDS:2 [Funneliformis geosporum]